MRNRTTVIAAAVVVVSSLLLVSCSCPPPARQPVDEGHRLTIIGLGDIHGQLEPFSAKADTDGDGEPEIVSTGGIARIATLIRQAEEENPGTVAVVFSGDALSDRYFHAFKGRAIYGLMSDAGYEISCFGNHEFDKGPDALARAIGSAEFDFLCTDLAVEGTVLDTLCVPYFIEDYDGLRVGYFSLITEGLPYLSSPGEVALTGSNAETALRAVRELHAQGAELIVALTHIGLEVDVELAREIPGVDIIFGGHSHSYLDEPIRMGSTFIVPGGERGTHLMRLDLETDADGVLDLETVRYAKIPITSGVPEAADIVEHLAVYTDSLPDAIVLGTTEVAWDLSSTAVRCGESPVANLINDRMRDKFGVDIVLNNGGAFRGKMVYEPGPVTDVMLRSIDEFGNHAIMFTINGAHLKSVLERSAASLCEGGFLHASGLRYTIESWRAAQQIAQDDAGVWAVTAPGERVTDITVREPDGTWQPLDPERDYRVLSNSFLINQAGDGYFWFGKHGRNMENTYSTFYSILEEIVNGEGVLNPEPPDGRIRIEGM